MTVKNKKVIIDSIHWYSNYLLGASLMLSTGDKEGNKLKSLLSWGLKFLLENEQNKQINNAYMSSHDSAVENNKTG